MRRLRTHAPGGARRGPERARWPVAGRVLLLAALLAWAGSAAAGVTGFHVAVLYTYPTGYYAGEGFNTRRDFGLHYTSDYPGGFDATTVHFADGSTAGLTLPGARVSFLSGLSDRGDAVGWSLAADGSGPHPVALLDRQLSQLDAADPRIVAATGINSQQQIAATIRSGGSEHAALVQGGTVADLGTLGGAQSMPRDLNNAGQVIGSAQAADGSWHAFLYSAGLMQNLDQQAGFRGEALFINDGGTIGGTYQDGVPHAFLFRDGSRVDLGPPDMATALAGLNNLGQAIGWANGQLAFWDGTARHDLLGMLLDPLEYEFRYYMGLNENGEVLFDACSVQKQACAFVLLTPVPEPYAVRLLLAGLGVLALGLRHRAGPGPARRSATSGDTGRAARGRGPPRQPAW